MPFGTVSWTRFHRPRFSAVHFRRRLTEELLDLIASYGAAMCTRGRSLIGADDRRARCAETLARWRLEKAGLIVTQPDGEGIPHLSLAPGWSPREVHHPDRCWNQPWSGIWFMLLYDVAEQDRYLRDLLRRFLRRLRMGCFQRSVWISPRDIRPEYADLVRSTGLGLSTHLVEARTATGCTDDSMVRAAWDWNEIAERHRWYLENAREQVEKTEDCRPSKGGCQHLAREEMSAYALSMASDPLLPSALLPGDYLGRKVFAMHRRFLRLLRPAFAAG